MCSTPTLASSSRHPVHLFWDPPVAQCYFPTSDLRSAHPPSRRSSIPPPHRVTPPQQESSCLHPTASKHSNLLPKRKQIEPGVWSDGNDRVLSAACPSVQAFLKSARRIMSLPPAPNESVFALAALDVFYHIDDPAHWMFWNDDKKHNTADIVSRISLHRPQLIQSRVAWNGTPEYLFILSSLHGTSSLPVYENKEWYPILNPSKVPSPPRVINLRKRKVQHVEQSEPSESAELEDVESRPKRVKPSSNPKRQPSPSGVSVDTNQTEMSQESPIGTSITSIEDTEVVPSSSAALEGKQAPLYTRKRKRPGRQPSQQLYPMTTILQEPSPNAMSVLLTPAVGSHSRNRSISQASSQTIVSARDRRSVSVLSAITAVEIFTPLRDELMKVDQITEESKEELGMVTRGRANKSRMVGQSKEGGRRSVKRTKRKGGIK